MSTLFTESSVRFVLRSLLRLGIEQREVEDLAQEVMVIAHRRRQDFDSSRAAEPWLYGIARNVARDHRRKAHTRLEVLGSESDVAERGEEQRASEELCHGNVSALRRALADLPEALRDVIVLCDLEEMTVAETAEALSTPLGTTKDRLRKARRLLEAALVQHGEVFRG